MLFSGKTEGRKGFGEPVKNDWEGPRWKARAVQETGDLLVLLGPPGQNKQWWT